MRGILRFASAALCVAAAAGCASNENAIELTERLGEGADRAMRSVESLRQAAEANAAADGTARKALEAMLLEHGSALDRASRERINALFHETTARILGHSTGIQGQLEREKQRVWIEIDAAIREAFRDCDEHEAGLSRVAHQAKEKAAKFPAEKPLAIEHRDALANYLAYAAASRELELDTWRNCRVSLDASFEEAGRKTQEATEAHLRAADKVLRDSLLQLRPLSAPASLGPVPVVDGDAYEAVLEYLREVKRAQRGMKDYLEMWSLNPSRNSVMKSFLGGFGKAFKETALKPGGAPPPDWRAVLGEWTRQLESAVEPLKGTMERLEENAKAALQKKVDEIVAEAKEKARAGIPRLSPEKIAKAQ